MRMNLFGPVSEYSIAIIPPREVTEVVASLKTELASAIGPFSSQNSAAHISLTSFRSDILGVQSIQKFLSEYTENLAPFTVRFISFASFPETFHIAPDQESDVLLKKFMKSFHQNSPKFPAKRYQTPHISIGRNLSAGNIQKAFSLIKTVDLLFQCDNISLRKLDKGQFRIEKIYTFKGK